MKKTFCALVVFCLIAFGATSLFSQVKVGEEIPELTQTQHPYAGGPGVVFEKEFNWPGAGYVSIHFSQFNLGPGDYVEISSPDGKFSYVYQDRGKSVRGGKAVLSEFWATHIPGDTAKVTLYSRSAKGGWGFSIDKWVRGYEKHVIQGLMGMDDEEEKIATTRAICNSDDKEWAKCYEGTTMYDKARAVARLLMNGSTACTGWLIGSEGHLMTNEHCIGSQSTADNTDFEFMAEGECTTNCASWFACPGTVEATSATVVQLDSALDYCLVLLPTNVSGTYGYMQLRDTLPTIGERMYIPQHPGAWGKQLAVNSDVDGGYCIVHSTDEPPCSGGPGDIGYYCDTAGGSSGSPVLGYADHLVISLHHCALCPNRGVPIPSIISDLGGNIPANAIGGGCTDPAPAAPSGLSANAPACDQVNLAWTDNASNEDGFQIERSTDGSNYTQIGSVGANVTSYSDTSAAGDTTYYYRVNAYNCGGNSAYSNVANVTTDPCPCVAPAAPSNLSAKGLPSRVNLTWDDNSNNEDGFKIYRGTTSSNLVLVATVGAGTTSYSDSGLARKTTYYYKVCAYNACGETCTSVISAKTK